MIDYFRLTNLILGIKDIQNYLAQKTYNKQEDIGININLSDVPNFSIKRALPNMFHY